MNSSLLSKANKTTLSHIDFQRTDYDFRQVNEEKNLLVKEEIKMLGQLYPVTLLDNSKGKYKILDGHRRCRLIKKLFDEESHPNEVLARIIPSKEVTPGYLYKVLSENNLRGDNAYGYGEKGRFFDFFFHRGVSMSDMAAMSTMPIHDIEDNMALSQAPLPLLDVLRPSKIPVIFAAMLMRRYLGWIQTPYAIHAPDVANQILQMAKNEPCMTMKTWRFYLDFYWNGKRPFLARSLNTK